MLKSIPLCKKLLICFGERPFVQEPSLEEEKELIYKSQVMITFTISDSVHAFLGSLHDSSIESQKVKELFPCYNHSKPCDFLDIPYEIGFMSSVTHVLCDAPYVKKNVYSKWLKKVGAKKDQFWKYHGLYKLVQLSRSGPMYNPNMLIAVLYLWEGSTNTFQLKCGMITPTLLDVKTITNLDQ